MWRDAQGIVNFSDRLPLSPSGQVKHLGLPKDFQSRTDLPQAVPKAAIRQNTGSDHNMEAPDVGTRSKSHDAPSDASRGTDCERLWESYFASAACYHPFRTKHGIKAVAYEACGEPVKDPSDRCVRRN